jgi:hypothetical protein
MRQFYQTRHKSILLLMVIVMLVAGLAAGLARAQNAPVGVPDGTPATAPAAVGGDEDDGSLTPAEILAVFQQEARAAYKMNQDACEGLATEEKKICLARARLQFDADMRYAQKRANQGY